MAVPVTPPGPTRGLVGLRPGMGQYVPSPAPRVPQQFGSGPGISTPYLPPVNPRVIGNGTPDYGPPVNPRTNPETGSSVYGPPVTPRTNPGVRTPGIRPAIPAGTTPPPATNPTPPAPPKTTIKGNPSQHWKQYARKRRGLGPRTTTSVTPEMIRRAAAMRMSS